jgi:PAS domain S-box-containing protein
MKNKAFYIFIFLGVIAFGVDLLTPRGTGVWAVYLLLLVFYIRVAFGSRIFQIAGIYSVLVILGYLISPEGVLPPHIAIINRTISLIIIGVLAFLAYIERMIRNVNAEILDRISDAFMAVDRNWNITYINRVASELSAIKEEDIIGKNIWVVLPELKGTIQEDYYRQAMETQQPVKFRTTGIFSKIDYEVSVYPSKQGITVYAHDITELSLKEKELQKNVSQKEMLLKEIHHRVKNNFQLVSSLIRLSTINLENEHITKIINEIETRIRTLSLIHEQLYRGTSGEYVDMKIYISSLVSQLHLLNTQAEGITYNLNIEDINLDIDSAISIGLIVNELYSNSIKHGFKNLYQGEIKIDITYGNADKKIINIIFQDNGSGIPEGKDIFKTESMGFTIVRTLIEQSHGTINFENKNGVKYFISIPVQKSDQNDHFIS